MSQPNSCRLVVKVENIKKIQGNLKLGVYDHQDKFLKTAVTWGDKEIVDNTVIFEFEGLKTGMYAVSIFHDENGNGKLDANFIGIPSEPYAFSNNAKGMFGPPSFDDCKFSLSGERKEITISL